ncbi:hypothetical protein QBC35DRAFT_122246 [Podospora australis]|uniref:Rhodopsin domain-containing protein n=1 Tax=Podospora australis TaxID=1536484 RepID=A0AAN6WYX8_9PEZI|nr:hypothetical protein QBC35DRAFT_122246 [Podospora australis]
MRTITPLLPFSTNSLSLVTLLVSPVLAQASNSSSLLTELGNDIPECVHGCMNELTNVTADAAACLALGVRDDEACLCSGDVSYYTRVLACVQEHCIMEESIETARGAWEACGKPQRSRKKDLLAPLSIAVLGLLCMLIRMYSRWWSVSHFEVDDYVMMVVTVLYIPFNAIGFNAAQDAFGVDIWTVDGSALEKALKFFYITETFYLTIISLTKVSILCFYLRIFPNRPFRICTYTVMAWVVISGVVFVFCQIFQCVPISYIWEGWKKGAYGPFHCLDISGLGYTVAGFSIVQDMVILIMPLPLLLRMNIALRSRIAIIFMFSLGIFVLVTSCTRLWALSNFGDSVNPTWDYTNVMIWTGLEVGVSIIVTSLPAIQVLFSRRRRRAATMLVVGSKALGGRNNHHDSTSSFGNTTTTVVVSWHTAPPPHLKRISAVSGISSINVDSPVEDLDLERQETHMDLGSAKMTSASVAPSRSRGSSVNEQNHHDDEGDRPLSSAPTIVGSQGGNPRRSETSLSSAYYVSRERCLSHMPSIDQILVHGRSPRKSAASASALSSSSSSAGQLHMQKSSTKASSSSSGGY